MIQGPNANAICPQCGKELPVLFDPGDPLHGSLITCPDCKTPMTIEPFVKRGPGPDPNDSKLY